MATELATPCITPEQLAMMPNDKEYELVDGRLVERNVGNKSSWIATRLCTLLANYVDEHNLGWVLAFEAGYRLNPGRPNTVRKPDVSFVASGRLPNDEPSDAYDRLAPDLAVEVISPGDRVYDLDKKIQEYLNSGVRLVWVVNPDVRTVAVHRSNRPIVILHESDELTGEDVVEGFRCSVSALFSKLAKGS